MSMITEKIPTGAYFHQFINDENNPSPVKLLERYGRVVENAEIQNQRGKNVKIDGLLIKDEEKYGIIWLNWNRKIGTNKVHQAERLVRETKLDGAIILGPAFSETAEELAKKITSTGRAKIVLLEQDIVSQMFTYNH